MIGKVMIGRSFKGCLQYCLNDKLVLNQIEAQVMQNRAEVLLYNWCFGNEKELVQQFNEIRQLNRKVSKPVMHITLSFAPGEKLPQEQLKDICGDCARDLGFENNQYVAIEHKDTNHRHLHIVVNRIGFDAKTLSDSNNYKKIAEHCRRMELKHSLQQVQSPNRYLSREEKQLPRNDLRKEQLKVHILQSVLNSKNYGEFEQKMHQLKYEVIKSRGIAFRDAQKVYTKGSDVGFSLSKIEKLLQLQPAMKEKLLQKNQEIKTTQINEAKEYQRNKRPYQQAKTGNNNRNENQEIMKGISKGISATIDLLLKPEQQNMELPKELLGKKIKRRKQKHPKPSL